MHMSDPGPPHDMAHNYCFQKIDPVIKRVFQIPATELKCMSEAAQISQRRADNGCQMSHEKGGSNRQDGDNPAVFESLDGGHLLWRACVAANGDDVDLNPILAKRHNLAENESMVYRRVATDQISNMNRSGQISIVSL